MTASHVQRVKSLKPEIPYDWKEMEIYLSCALLCTYFPMIHPDIQFLVSFWEKKKKKLWQSWWEFKINIFRASWQSVAPLCADGSAGSAGRAEHTCVRRAVMNPRAGHSTSSGTAVMCYRFKNERGTEKKKNWVDERVPCMLGCIMFVFVSLVCPVECVCV